MKKKLTIILATCVLFVQSFTPIFGVEGQEPVDWAFTEASRSLHDAILTKYPEIDTDGDLYISIQEANNWIGDDSGSLRVRAKGISGSADGIEYFTMVDTFDLSENSITSLPVNLGNLSNALSLDISHNPIGSLPESIGNMTRLESLYAKENGLTELPESFGNLQNLDTLALAVNKFEVFPEVITNLPALRTFTINDNKLKEIPDSIGNLVNLQIFDAQRNGIETLPNSLTSLTKLISFTFDQNSLINVTNEVMTFINGLMMKDIRNQSYTKSIGTFTVNEDLLIELYQVLNVLHASGQTLKMQLITPSDEIVPLTSYELTADGKILIHGDELSEVGDYILIFSGMIGELRGSNYQFEFKIDHKYASVSFESNGGSAVEAYPKAIVGDTIVAPTSPIKEGFTFGGWYLDEALTSAWDFDLNTVEKDTILYARWVEVEEPTEPTEPSVPSEPQPEPEAPTVKPVEPSQQLPSTGMSDYNVAYYIVALGAVLIRINFVNKRRKEHQ